MKTVPSASGNEDIKGEIRQQTVRDFVERFYRDSVHLAVPAIDEEKMLKWWFEWPPDVFALTSTIFRYTGIYVRAVLPRDNWPKSSWKERLNVNKKRWLNLLSKELDNEKNQEGEVRTEEELKAVGDPMSIEEYKGNILYYWNKVTIKDLVELDQPVSNQTFGEDSTEEKVRKDNAWGLCRTLLELHGLADETCAGFGTLSGHYWRNRGEEIQAEAGYTTFLADLSLLHFAANVLLAHTGTLSRIPSHILRVLPKIRTSSVGLTLRGASHYLTVHQTEAAIKWRTLPLTNIDEDTVNIMILPYPYDFQPTWFAPSEYGTKRETRETNRYFDYSGPSSELNPEWIIQLLRNAEEKVNRVHMIVLPELSLTEANLHKILDRLAEEQSPVKLPIVLAGVRHKTKRDNNFEVTLGTNKAVLAIYFAGKWYIEEQNKNHRWKLDENQIRQYNLGGVLAGSKEWSESTHIPRRQLSILAPNQWFTLSCLICEDLARQEPIADIIRGIGPTLTVALLLDGPQLKERWPGRYASVLADDPGTSVLTLSSLGFVQSSRKSGVEDDSSRSSTIALWKDGINGAQEINLPEKYGAAVITVTAQWTEEMTLAGRTDKDSGAVLVWEGIHFLDKPNCLVELASKDLPNLPGTGFIRSDIFDFRELSLLACFIDAAIGAIDVKDAPVENGINVAKKWKPSRKRIKQLAGIMLETQINDCFITTHLDAIIKSEVQEIIKLNQEKQSQQQPRDNPDPYVHWTKSLITRILIETHQIKAVSPFDLEIYKQLVNYSEHILKFVSNEHSEFHTSLENKRDPFETLRGRYKAIPRHRRSSFGLDIILEKQYVRICTYVPLAFLWAIHARLTDLRHVGKLSPKYNQLLIRIESLLEQRWDKTWQNNYGKGEKGNNNIKFPET